MADSSLYLTYDDLRAEIGRYMTITRDDTNWTADHVEEVDQIIKGGLRMAYWPPALPDTKHAHQWSFLTIQHNLTTTSGAFGVDMPEDFTGVAKNVTYTAGSDTRCPIVHRDESQWREMSSVDVTGYPRYYCVVPSKVNGGAPGTPGQRWTMLLWPKPDSNYAIQMAYDIAPEALDGTTHHRHYGGPMFSELVIQSCLAIAERRYDHHESTYQYDQFLRMLAAAVDRDAQSHSPRKLGYNGDGSTSQRRPYTGVDTYNDTPV